MNILMILHMPWSRDLGGPKASMELADELRMKGHTVDKFDVADALPQLGRLGSYFMMPLFTRRAVEFVRKNGFKYDVIQAEQGNLAVPRQSLRFGGLLIARSSGLMHHHVECAERMKSKWKGAQKGRLAGNVMRWVASKCWGLKDVEGSFASADLIVAINRDERDYIANRLGYQNSIFLPNGITDQRRAELRDKGDELLRLQERRVVFIGQWAASKGALDLPLFAAEMRKSMPGVRYRLLGTGESVEAVLSSFDVMDRPAIEVIPRFSSAELPDLLRNCAVGVFPSYMEGFGIAVLEKLAAGLPVVAYDVPGST